MAVLSEDEDAFGRLLVEHLEGRAAEPAWLERDDGWRGPAEPATDFFDEHDSWPPIERDLITHARGRILDLGAGAGRHALHLQNAGHDVVALDHSPGAVAVCRARGLRHAEVRELWDVPAGAPFDTVLMLCQNLGLAGTITGTRELLGVLYGRVRPGGVLLGDTVDPLMFEPLPPHREYHEASPLAGRDLGQLRLRWRHRDRVTPWRDLLCLRRQDLGAVLDGTGWELEHLYEQGAQYGVVLRRH